MLRIREVAGSTGYSGRIYLSPMGKLRKLLHPNSRLLRYNKFEFVIY